MLEVFFCIGWYGWESIVFEGRGVLVGRLIGVFLGDCVRGNEVVVVIGVRCVF